LISFDQSPNFPFQATQSLPGGPIQPESTGDGSSGTATLAPNNNDKDAFDRSLEARSEFYPAHPHHPQHRRSSRKQQMMMVVGGSLIDRGGGGGQAIQLQPFNDIGNGRGGDYYMIHTNYQSIKGTIK
jgi:hypothetical protein